MDYDLIEEIIERLKLIDPYNDKADTINLDIFSIIAQLEEYQELNF